MKETELKPCPFCGGNAELYDDTECGGFGLYVKRFFVICEECHASGGEANDYVDKGNLKKLAIKRWNRRTDNEQREAD